MPRVQASSITVCFSSAAKETGWAVQPGGGVSGRSGGWCGSADRVGTTTAAMSWPESRSVASGRRESAPNIPK